MRAMQVLQSWQSLLHDGTFGAQVPGQAHAQGPSWQAQEIREVLQAAIRLRHGRVSSVVPEQLLTAFMNVYGRQQELLTKAELFHLLASEFGVDQAQLQEAIEAHQHARGGQTVLLLQASFALVPPWLLALRLLIVAHWTIKGEVLRCSSERSGAFRKQCSRCT